MVGPGKPIDTDRYFVICANVVGGCMGTTGPASTNPATDRAYGLDLPVITVRDMVRAQAMLLDQLGIETLFSVAGGSMGGMQVLQWAATYPERVFSALPIATGARHSSQNIAFHEVGRQAVMADPDWRGGRYFEAGIEPAEGPRRRAHGGAHHLSVRRARCTGSSAATCRTATSRPSASTPTSRSSAICATRGSTFVDRFDANSYLYMTRAMDYFDLAADYGGRLANAFLGTQDALLRRLVHLRLAVPDGRRARRWCAR